jgi:rod shape-determining protein MreC
MEASDELGFASGQGDRPLRVELLNGKADVKKGDRLVTFGSQADKPFVPGVPVGVVVQAPKKDPRDTVLPSKPKPVPTPTVTVTVTPNANAPVDGQQQ